MSPRFRTVEIVRKAMCALACVLLGTLAPHHVAADDYDIYIAAGQSNMDGRGNIAELTGELAFWDAAQPDAIIHYSSPPISEGSWTTLSPGFANASTPPRSTRFGPELSFAAEMSASSNRKVAIIKVSRGGTNLATDWAPGSGSMYQGLETAVATAMQELADRGDTGSIRGMIWHQGESDDVPSRRPEYETNLTNFIDSVRNDLLGMPELPFVVGELLQEFFPGQFAEIRQAQFNVSQSLHNVGFASSIGLQTTDGLHFDTLGVISMGSRLASEMQAVLVPEPATSTILLTVLASMACTRHRRSTRY